jgi:hypothetical protein
MTKVNAIIYGIIFVFLGVSVRVKTNSGKKSPVHIAEFPAPEKNCAPLTENSGRL